LERIEKGKEKETLKLKFLENLIFESVENIDHKLDKKTETRGKIYQKLTTYFLEWPLSKPKTPLNYLFIFKQDEMLLLLGDL
jgi:hypothetical protein